MRSRIAFVLILFSTFQNASAKVILPLLFSDNMVLQQKDNVALWGQSTIAKSVVITTSWNHKKFTVVSNADGSWKINVPTPKPGGPYTITFNDGEELVLNNILIGEVWLCSGQSNMEMPIEGWGKIKNFKEEITAADFPNIRLIKVEKSTSTQPLTQANIKERWQPCSPKTVADFSAVAYFFARNIQQHHNIPIGLIQTAYSGTPAESWTSGPALKTMPEYASLVDVISSKPGAPNDSHIPTVLFNAMVNPLIPYAIRGVIWYQGEANDRKAQQYKRLFPLLINDWRKNWGNKTFPFFYVQLANFTEAKAEPGGSTWAELREAQLQTLQVPHTGMAVTIDIGDAKDIHPKNKQDVGLRLALIARAKVYKEKLVYSGPIYRSYKIKSDKIEIMFNHTHGGLQAKNNDDLKGFSIAGEDKKFYWAHARIKGNKIIVWCNKAEKPVAVRYAWANNPECNLYNKAGLPASPFRTDTWKGITE
ncbi:MAG: Sialate O-acetylesterase [Chitinophagaceae bacterium]|nr:Sialate O-acetylesterase [Chitinophagaceae bacterium]